MEYTKMLHICRTKRIQNGHDKVRRCFFKRINFQFSMILFFSSNPSEICRTFGLFYLMFNKSEDGSGFWLDGKIRFDDRSVS